MMTSARLWMHVLLFLSIHVGAVRNDEGEVSEELQQSQPQQGETVAATAANAQELKDATAQQQQQYPDDANARGSSNKEESMRPLWREEDGILSFESMTQIGSYLQHDKPQSSAQRREDTAPHAKASILMLLVYTNDCSWLSKSLEIFREARPLLSSLQLPYRNQPLPLGKITWDDLMEKKENINSQNEQSSGDKKGKEPDSTRLSQLQQRWKATATAMETGVPFVCLVVQDSNQREEIMFFPDVPLSKPLAAPALVQLYVHYYYRLVVATDSVYVPTSSITSKSSVTPLFLEPRHFETMTQVQQFACQHQERLFSTDRPGVDPQVPPFIPDYEADTYQELMLLASEHEDPRVFVQCRWDNQDTTSRQQQEKGKQTTEEKRLKETTQKLYDTYSQLHRAMIQRPDLLYVTVSNCGDVDDTFDGMVFAWRLPTDQLGTCEWDQDHDLLPGLVRVQPSTTQTETSPQQLQRSIAEDLVQFHHVQASPDIMWYNGAPTGAIAFPSFRKVHALLFLDFHTIQLRDENPKDLLELQQSLVQTFQQICRDWRRGNNDESEFSIDADMVCLILPSTETRWLATFGIDPWTAADNRLMALSEMARQTGGNDHEKAEDEYRAASTYAAAEQARVSPPVFVMTDRRGVGGLLRYTLDSPTPDSMTRFVKQFWGEKLVPDPKTPATSKHVIVNKYGVHSIQGGGGEMSLGALIRENRQRGQHMVILFISPTCGHCKRLLTMYSQLSQILRAAPGWDKVVLYTLDVTTQETALLGEDGVTFSVKWLPELAYLSPAAGTSSSTPPVQYYGEPKKNKLAGDMNHYGTLMEWLLDVLDFDDEKFTQLLQSLKDHQQKR